MIGFRLSAQKPPDAKRIKDDVVMRFDHVYEVDPALMTEHTPQQDIPAWDTLRIVESRNEHLNWMHEHFADETLVAGIEPELDLGPGQPSGQAYPAPPEAPARHPQPILPY